MKRFVKVFLSYAIAVIRHFFWSILFIVLGLQRILFTRTEIVGFQLKESPLRCDLEDMGEKLSYIDKMCMENPELIEDVDEDILEDVYFDDEDD